MPRQALNPVLEALSTAIGASITPLEETPPAVRRAALAAIGAEEGGVGAFAVGDERYLASRYHHHRTAILVLGPYRREDDPPGLAPCFDGGAEARARAALKPAAEGFGQALTYRRDRLELASRLELIDSAAIAITSELSLDTVLRRIVDLAREVVGAKFAALGVANEHGEIVQFVQSGLTSEEVAAIGDPPRGHGMVGLLIHEPKTVRLADLRSHPASVGFPPNHPPMRSFLGVPITSHGRVLGNLYLTEKQLAAEFTEEDARLVELLARHAAVAIDNARLYRQAELQKQRLQAIIDQLPEGVLMVESNPDRVTLANAQATRLLGWPVQPPLPLTGFLERNPRFHADDSPMVHRAVPLVRALHEGDTARSEVRMVRPDGSSITVLVNTAPLRNERGEVAAAIAVFQDITEIKDADQLKDDFLSLVSHELRTPMTTIQGGAMLLLHDGDSLDDETRRMLLSDIASESHRLAGLVENMVQLTNIRAGRFGMDNEPIHVRTLIERAVKAIRESAPDHAFAVEVKGDLLGLGDPLRIDQVVRNLLQNAVKYAPGSAPIEVNAARNDGMVVIAVRDHGPGISEEDLPFVFERFRRGDEARRNNAAGMGLGLYLSKHLVEAHGGRIWIERPADGGTTVKFSMPATADDEE